MAAASNTSTEDNAKSYDYYRKIGFFARDATVSTAALKSLIAVLRQTQRSNLSLALIESGDPLATAEVEMLLTAPADAAPVPDCRKTIDWERKVRLLLGRNAVSA